jgi:RHS repeat-associated protein
VFVVSQTDYLAYGQAMPDRTYNSTALRYTFNGKEEEIFAEWQDYGFRNYDKRQRRFTSIDPLTAKYPELTPFQFASNRPIDGIDLDGLEFQQFMAGWETAKAIFNNIPDKRSVFKSIGTAFCFVELDFGAGAPMPIFNQSWEFNDVDILMVNKTYQSGLAFDKLGVTGFVASGAIDGYSSWDVKTELPAVLLAGISLTLNGSIDNQSPTFKSALTTNSRNAIGFPIEGMVGGALGEDLYTLNAGWGLGVKMLYQGKNINVDHSISVSWTQFDSGAIPFGTNLRNVRESKKYSEKMEGTVTMYRYCGNKTFAPFDVTVYSDKMEVNGKTTSINIWETEDYLKNEQNEN